MNIDELYHLYQQYPSVKTDTRKLQEGDLFFALKGPNFNGNLFAAQALQAGAAYAITDDDIAVNDSRIVRVPNALEALQALAKRHRQQLAIPVVAITGSNGKTTTKELLHAVLSAHYITYTTTGNLNNHIGVPLTLLSIKSDAQMAIIEMGANHLHEIEGYCRYALPTHGIITNVGKAHLEGFGSAENIAIAKGELYDFIRENHGVVFAFYDYEYLHRMANGIQEIHWYGTQQGEVAGFVAAGETLLNVAFSKGVSFTHIQTQLVGSYNLPNVLCAVAAGKYFNVPDEKIKAAIEAYQPSNSRSQLLRRGSNTIILDAYNANPSSMKAAIENFAAMPAGNKVVILGGMAELGPDSEREHQQIADLLQKSGFENVLLSGDYFKGIKHPYLHIATIEEAKDWLQKKQFTNTHILIKGSRSTQMERVLE